MPQHYGDITNVGTHEFTQPVVIAPTTVALLPAGAADGSICPVTDDPVNPLWVMEGGVWTPSAQPVELQSTLTLAVSTTGSDTPTADRPARLVGGDYSAYPFLTIQAAIDSLPKSSLLRSPLGTVYDVTINVAAGTYGGFNLIGFGYNVLIAGVREAFTPATGPQSGTFTSGTGGRTLVLTGAGWTTDDLVGKMLYITSGAGAGQVIPIFSNTSDTIVLAGRSSPVIGAGSVFSIEDPAVVLNTAGPDGSTARATAQRTQGFKYTNIKTTGGIGFSQVYCRGFCRIENCVAVTGSGSNGFGASNSISGNWSGCAVLGVSGSSTGFLHQSCVSLGHTRCMATNCGTNGGLGIFLGIGWEFVSMGFSAKNCAYGVLVFGGSAHIIEEPVCEGCTVGIALEQTQAELQDPIINNSTSKALRLQQATAEINGVIQGTGNAGFGVDASGVGNHVWLASTPTLTGAAGDATADGVNAVAWADLSAAGDYVVDDNTGSRISRK